MKINTVFSMNMFVNNPFTLKVTQLPAAAVKFMALASHIGYADQVLLLNRYLELESLEVNRSPMKLTEGESFIYAQLHKNTSLVLDKEELERMRPDKDYHYIFWLVEVQ